MNESSIEDTPFWSNENMPKRYEELKELIKSTGSYRAIPPFDQKDRWHTMYMALEGRNAVRIAAESRREDAKKLAAGILNRKVIDRPKRTVVVKPGDRPEDMPSPDISRINTHGAATPV